ncbi:MAG: DNA internalization-related competence protein ComEC/Rec2 [Planctomycetota bacterium]|nr:MAG: DNA internalization-related competence protein ComEC/Rec2 [Planctomycetota bacterium]
MDEIQRKLELIDRQLAGGYLANLHKKLISTTPLLFVAVGLIAGIIIQALSGLSIWLWVILLAIAVTLVVFSYLVSRISHLIKEENLSYVMAYVVLLCFLCLGAMRLISFERPETNDICNFIGGERKLATIRGLIVTKPYVNREQDWEFAKFMYTDPVSSFYLKVKEVETMSSWAEASGTVRVQVGEPVLDLKDGDYIQAYCWLDRFKGATNPGQFDIARYLARRGVFIAASIESRDGIEFLQSGSAGIFTKIKRKVREKAAQALLGGISPEDQSRGLLEALLLGYRGNIDSETYEAFRKTGLLHFISLSGLHLGILMGVIWWLCKTAGLMKRTRAIICIIAIGVFLLIVPPRAPTLRTAIICCVFCVSFLFYRKSNSLNTLSLAAIILLLIRPTQLFEAGWQLSFATVLGILLFANRIHFFIYEKITEQPWFKKLPRTRPFFRIISKPGSYLLRLFSVGLAAWLGGAGILLYHFYTINPLASIWTVFAFPLVVGILTTGFLKIVISFLLPTAAMILGATVTILADLLILVVKLLAHLDISQILIGHVSIVPVVFYYVLVIFAGFVYFKRPIVKRAICTAMILALIICLGALKWQRTNRDGLVITCLDVSHGQAILARLPGPSNILLDGGSLHKNDIGRRIVTPFLDYIGITEIDSIIISHSDIDHINGIVEIAEHCKVGSIYANEAFFDKADKWGAAKFLNESLRRKELEVQAVGRNLNLGGNSGIKFIWPNEEAGNISQLSDNDRSTVSLIEFAGRRIVLCSDIEKFAQEELLGAFADLKVDIVVVPHHGSVRTLATDFIKNLDAEILICSCGRGEYDRQQVIMRENKAKLFYTARDGAITVRVDKKGLTDTEAFLRN